MMARMLEWLRRYLPLELMATAFSMAGGLGAAALGANAGVIAYVATAMENVGFYGYALSREVRLRLGASPISPATVGPLLLPASRNLLGEFGPAELIDSFVLRPACLYALPKLTGNLAIGLLLGKLAADAAFYGLAVIAYERRKARFSRSGSDNCGPSGRPAGPMSNP